eukprot:208170-Chlamydomonas_euryale.AAC.6
MKPRSSRKERANEQPESTPPPPKPLWPTAGPAFYLAWLCAAWSTDECSTAAHANPRWRSELTCLNGGERARARRVSAAYCALRVTRRCDPQGKGGVWGTYVIRLPADLLGTGVRRCSAAGASARRGSPASAHGRHDTRSCWPGCGSHRSPIPWAIISCMQEGAGGSLLIVIYAEAWIGWSEFATVHSVVSWSLASLQARASCPNRKVFLVGLGGLGHTHRRQAKRELKKSLARSVHLCIPSPVLVRCRRLSFSQNRLRERMSQRQDAHSI